jgi:hypothetical protein
VTESVLRWRAALLAGALPALVLGFAASAAANKLAFAVLYAVFLRWGLQSRWGGWVLAGRLLLLFAAGAAVWARLAMRHGEELDLGWRALLDDFYFPGLAQPRSAAGVTVALAIGGALSILIGHGAERRRR